MRLLDKQDKQAISAARKEQIELTAHLQKRKISDTISRSRYVNVLALSAYSSSSCRE